MDLPTVLTVVESACREFAVSVVGCRAGGRQQHRSSQPSHTPPLHPPPQNPATHAQAERTLQEFRGSPQPYEACRYILSAATDPSAKFQAVHALRDAALREWATQPPPMLQDLLRFLLETAIVRTSGDAHPLVCRQACAAAATLLKRAWGDASPADRHSLVTEIGFLAAQAGTAEAHRASMDVLQAITVEFSPITCSPMGLPWGYHDRCRQDLQAEYLLGFLQRGMEMARQAAGAAVAGADAGVCQSSLALLSSLLSWDHGGAGRGGGGAMPTNTHTGGDGQRPGDTELRVHPPAAWRDLLLAEGAWEWLAELAAAVRAAPGQAAAPLAAALRQVLVQLASLSGDIFVKEGDRSALGLSGGPGPYTAAAHLRMVLAIVLPSVTPPAAAAAAAAAGEDDAVLDSCCALLAAAAVHRMSGFVEASRGVDGGIDAVLGAVSQLTEGVLAAGDAGSTPEAADVLLEMWTELVVDPCRGAAAGSERAASAAAAVFDAAVRRELGAAAAAALEDEGAFLTVLASLL